MRAGVLGLVNRTPRADVFSNVSRSKHPEKYSSTTLRQSGLIVGLIVDY
jgi:hypothetical protein